MTSVCQKKKKPEKKEVEQMLKIDESMFLITNKRENRAYPYFIKTRKVQFFDLTPMPRATFTSHCGE